jgi:hypothetical protein
MYGPVKNRKDLPEPTALLAEYLDAWKRALNTHGLQPHHLFPEDWMRRLVSYLKANDPEMK